MPEKLMLVDMPAGSEAKIVELKGGGVFQSRLRSLGLVEGHRIKRVSEARSRGPVIVLVNRAQVAIGWGMAARIMVSLNGDQQEE